MEENFGRALVIARGDYGIFVTRPISGVVLGISAALLVWSVGKALHSHVRGKTTAEET